MTTFDIDIDVSSMSSLENKLKNFNKETFPNTKQAFNAIVLNIQRQWQDWARGGELPNLDSIPRASASLANSIKTRFQNDFDAIVFTNSPRMSGLENGYREVDMKKTYPYGKKSRVSKKGVPYLIIPFRWGTPNDKGEARYHFASVAPEWIVSLLRKRKASERTENTHAEPNANGEEIERSE